MRSIDIGAGPDFESWFPGAYILEENLLEELLPRNMEEGKDYGYDFSEIPADMKFDLIWCNDAHRFNMADFQTTSPEEGDRTSQWFAEEVTRIAAPSATCIISDWACIEDPRTGMERKISFNLLRHMFTSSWEPLGWKIKSFSTHRRAGGEYRVLDEEQYHDSYVVVLTRAWGG
jgi:hypothetical protein